MDYDELLAIKWGRFRNAKLLLDSLESHHPLRKVSICDLDRSENIAFLSQVESAYFFSEHDTENNKKWFSSKISELKESTERKAVSSILGELRAYSVLKKSDFGEKLVCKSGKGSDFESSVTVNGYEQKVIIEVNTPLGRDDEKRTTIDHGTSADGNFKTGIKEYAPFGFPERKEIDSIGSEVISKVNSIKEDEQQFSDDAINILFVDYVNPFLSTLDIMHGHCKPFMFHNSVVYTGNLWWGMYAKKCETVFFEKAFHYPKRYAENDTYKMEYDGKLVKAHSKVDFVIFNMYDEIFVLEKLFPHKLKIPKELYLTFMTMQGIKYEHLWINYPLQDLSDRIQNIKQQAEELYKTASFLPEQE